MPALAPAPDYLRLSAASERTGLSVYSLKRKIYLDQIHGAIIDGAWHIAEVDVRRLAREKPLRGSGWKR